MHAKLPESMARASRSRRTSAALPGGRELTAPERSRPSALVVSLDFELHWGVRDLFAAEGHHRAKLLAARAALPRILDMFVDHGVHATWATVGLLFARSADEARLHWPAKRPRYRDGSLDAWQEPIGHNEDNDPVHLAPSLVRLISTTPGQEVGSHTFTHFYCLEAARGDNRIETFRADVAAARSIAAVGGYEVSSLVVPRNQWVPELSAPASQTGFRAYRGSQSGFPYRPRPRARQQTTSMRVVRLLDMYVNLTGDSLVSWEELSRTGEPFNVAASRYLQPFSPSRRRLDAVRLRRIVRSMKRAAETGQIFHLWWHPEDFGEDTEDNLAVLGRVLDGYDRLRKSHGMVSLNMAEVAELATGGNWRAA
jgi:peptidoglycan/xylan/chitin deacetylase (PgdA/CDA1 family)